MNKKWVIHNKKFDIEDTSRWGIRPITARILRNRNISGDDIKYILSDDLQDLNSEDLLYGIDRAVNFIIKNIRDKKKIRVIGDYDIDGVCATYILLKGIKNVGGIVDYRVPHRVKDGYGINKNIINEAISDKVDLIITCDNGVSAGDEITYAKENGIEVIVTDHHEILNIPKDAYAVINPKLDCEKKYPFSEICGATVSLKVVKKLYELSAVSCDWTDLIEFSAIATIGDIMPNVNENHIIIKFGLKKITSTKNIGLKKLIEISNLKDKEITPYHIGFILGPMINASGRLMTAEYAIELFLTDDEERANELSLKLKMLNEERKYETELGKKEGLEYANNMVNDKVLVIYLNNVKESIAGIVAGKIRESLNKPVIVLTESNEENILKASCRSIDEYDIFFELSKFSKNFIKFGGHKMAAGFSMDKKYLDDLRAFLNKKCELKDENFIKKIYIDAEVPLKYVTLDMIRDIEKIAPFGNGIENPLFATKNVKIKVLNVYESKNVISLLIKQDEISFKSVTFMDFLEFTNLTSGIDSFDIIYTPTINKFNGNINIELNIKDFRPYIVKNM